ncbi:mitotic-spindle organizing protein 2B isoform X1 [Manis pentadactyla]|uniref:mitotic-spindle organizing protein 2B isoform X1 n=1 Tax=Manis pentadactyla TaxID=143292 RepID=UPI00255CB559|nr:mitotic-spindle organizing protein 2B isoform X1 [Manis pentadactyla]
MAAPGAGPGPGPPPGLEAALQKLALRRKKVLSAEEMELYELAQAAGGAIDPDVFKILVDLLKLNVAPLAVFQMLKSMCAGQRLASEPQDPAAVSLSTSSVSETREASFLSAKNCSPPARPSFSSAPRPAASPVLRHGPAATHSPLSPGAPASLRFSCCLFSPFAGCVYWFISGGWCSLSFLWKLLWPQKAKAAFSCKGRTLWAIPAIQLRGQGHDYTAQY